MAAAGTVAGQESCARSVLEHLPNTLVGLGGTLQVLVGTNLLADLLTLHPGVVSNTSGTARLRVPSKTYLLRGDGLLAGLAELLNGLVVVSQILLATNQDDGKALAEVKNLRDPLFGTCQQEPPYLGPISLVTDLLLNVVQRIGRVDSEADEDDMGVRV